MAPHTTMALRLLQESMEAANIKIPPTMPGLNSVSCGLFSYCTVHHPELLSRAASSLTVLYITLNSVSCGLFSYCTVHHKGV